MDFKALIQAGGLWGVVFLLAIREIRAIISEISGKKLQDAVVQPVHSGDSRAVQVAIVRDVVAEVIEDRSEKLLSVMNRIAELLSNMAAVDQDRRTRTWEGPDRRRSV